MARGRQRATWDHTASMIATIRGLFDSSAGNPLQYHPYANESATRQHAPTAAESAAAFATLRGLIFSGAFK